MRKEAREAQQGRLCEWPFPGLESQGDGSVSKMVGDLCLDPQESHKCEVGMETSESRDRASPGQSG